MKINKTKIMVCGLKKQKIIEIKTRKRVFEKVKQFSCSGSKITKGKITKDRGCTR